MIDAYLVGATEVSASLDARASGARGKLRDGIGRLALKLSTRVKRDKLSGQVLGVRTSRLRRSVRDLVTETGDNINGIVSTNVSYGIGWERGWPNTSPRASLDAAKDKFDIGSSTMFKNGTPKLRSFLGTALKDLEASGEIRTELNAVAAAIAS